MDGAQAKSVIDRFTKETGYDFLSNFYPASVTFEGKQYPTIEHAYQASKTLNSDVRELIRKSPNPMQAKKLGRAIQLREDWNDVKVSIMKLLVAEKFKSPFLAHKLVATGNSQLVMRNFFNDTFWGECRGRGENWLGKILMEVREEIKKNEEEECVQFCKTDIKLK